MNRRVTTLPVARREVRDLLTYIASRSQPGGNAWVRAYQQALSRLEQDAEDCALAEESRYVAVEVRELLFKTRRGLAYRIIFTIRGDEVFVLHVRGPGQDWMSADELSDDLTDG